uniref:Sulfotransferase domain-containing protein n=1 Tax=Aplanochytrium stocchinoi TaxID=215587 RepID=A0A7S3UZH3_9STRA|mmetsp:Transcript_37067/g.46375  ORF Transcript_37067/g.46375 Transcript_37067/m.46375 type:complete len:426 (+) Transcript_37067:197-1474(+)|eukprot:CAMPEP_0204831144 /NCGR_PEP_ID=MMETSP1346-20131115/9986_1 /ASSEMBLY_ACC=CAM_ASM_000771 /TAXON_ID=215587 /ORGANISM="Aplanochytrium stocchinoi, Strain GSBS06" /LENGTH=425 /DNA_ID=CAMNT_0051961937 /DNA_START=118 /DNA_END=1395 /DNA_ORIENTATION=-
MDEKYEKNGTGLPPDSMQFLEKGIQRLNARIENGFDKLNRNIEKRTPSSPVSEARLKLLRFLLLVAGFALVALFFVFTAPTHKEHPLQHYQPAFLSGNSFMSPNSKSKSPSRSYIDRWWESGRDYRKIAAFDGEIKQLCRDEVVRNPDEFTYPGPVSENIRNKLVFVVHHKTGTHLLRNIQNELLRLAGVNEAGVGGCHQRDLPSKIKWARRLEFWCKLVLRPNMLYPLYKKGNRLVNLARHPRNMLISQHVYQKALQDANLKFGDILNNKDHKFYKGLKSNDTLMAWEGTMEVMAPVINDMVKHMQRTVGDPEVLTVEMESHFYKSFDNTVKQILYHLLEDKVSPEIMCQLRLQASFQDTKRFGAAVDDSHASTHVASTDKKAIAKKELDDILACDHVRCKNFQEKYNKWVDGYAELTKILWKF